MGAGVDDPAFIVLLSLVMSHSIIFLSTLDVVQEGLANELDGVNRLGQNERRQSL